MTTEWQRLENDEWLGKQTRNWSGIESESGSGRRPETDENHGECHECEESCERGHVGFRAACKHGDDGAETGECREERGEAEDVACRSFAAVA